ncbi:recombinase family protein [Pseudarthrobacter sp. P1]|uniref:recombinase family protein n=1 Tax=Pseudarthrobacter sp. P1 TaxID=3418418 RepID=UPI003CF428F0
MQDKQFPAAIYCRISSDREGAGLGVQRQEQDCRELAASLGWQVTRVYTDNDISAYSGKRRPAYREMLDAMQSGRVRGVIAWHTDRLHRSPRELEEYIDISEQQSVTTHTVKAGEIDLSTPSGRAVARTLGAWARYESEHKSDRGKRKQLQLAQAGKFTGGPVPFGWEMVDKLPVIVEADAAEIRKAVNSIIAGASIGSIVRDLNDRGILTRRNMKWTSTAVRNLVMRPTNAGQAVYRGEIMGKSVFPPIVSVDQWRTATAIVKDPSRRSAFDSKVKHLLAGMLRCGKCGEAMQTSSRAGGTDATRFYYKCTTAGDGHSFQTAQPVEELISAVTVAMLESQHVSGKMPMPGDTEKLASLQDHALTLRGRLEESANSYADGAITAQQLEAITARVRSQLDEANASMAQLGHGSPLPGPDVANIREWWAAAGIERQRAIIDTLMTVYVDPIRKSAPRTFDPDRIRIEWKQA